MTIFMMGNSEIALNLSGDGQKWRLLIWWTSLWWWCVEKYYLLEEGLHLDQSGSVMNTLNIDMDGVLYLGLWLELWGESKRYNLHVICVVMQPKGYKMLQDQLEHVQIGSM